MQGSEETTAVTPRLRQQRRCLDAPFPYVLFLLCFRYGFGDAGKPKFGIEPNAELMYEVTLKSFEKVRKSNCSKSW